MPARSNPAATRRPARSSARPCVCWRSTTGREARRLQHSTGNLRQDSHRWTAGRSWNLRRRWNGSIGSRGSKESSAHEPVCPECRRHSTVRRSAHPVTQPAGNSFPKNNPSQAKQIPPFRVCWISPPPALPGCSGAYVPNSRRRWEGRGRCTAPGADHPAGPAWNKL